VEGAIRRYRVLAYIVGALLVLLTIGMVLKYLPPKEAALVSVVAPIHGLLYMVYLVTAFDVWRRAGWPLSRMVAIVLAGVVPLMTFVIERRVVRDAQATLEDSPAPAV
jgi:integral membrane protein